MVKKASPFTKAGDMKSEDVHVKIALFGDPGSGKTWGACTAPDSLVLLTEQNGMTSIRQSNPDAFVVHCRDIETVRRYLTMAVKDELKQHGIRTLVIDSLTEVQRLFKDEIMAGKGASGFTIQDWGTLQEKMRLFLRTIRSIPYHVVATALAQTTLEESTGIRYVLPSFQGKNMPTEVAQYFSVVGYMAKKETTNENGERIVKHRALLDGAERYMTKPCFPLTGVQEVNIENWISTIIGGVSAKKEN